MANYNPSTIARIGDIVNGIRVDTSGLAAATYMITGPTQTEIFNVYGRIKIHELFGEVSVADFSAHANVLKYTLTMSTPVIAVADIQSVSASLTGLKIGERISWIGGAVASAVVITGPPAVTDVQRISQIVGVNAGVGTIGINTATASITGLSVVTFSIFYTPMSDGAYVTKVL